MSRICRGLCWGYVNATSSEITGMFCVPKSDLLSSDRRFSITYGDLVVSITSFSKFSSINHTHSSTVICPLSLSLSRSPTKYLWSNSPMGCTPSPHYCLTATTTSTPAPPTCRQTSARSQVCLPSSGRSCILGNRFLGPLWPFFGSRACNFLLREDH